jgi:murein DD-endopeptidase MepM/ murein hydrolase activator NlpD
MSFSKNKTVKKKTKKNKKNIHILLFFAVLIILFIAFGFFLFFNKDSENIYVFPENPKQGDTIFIKVKTTSDSIEGNFENKKITFLKKGISEQISFLGIDATQTPGEYDIFVNTLKGELVKKIKVSLADFSLTTPAKAPDLSQSGYTNSKAIDNIKKNDNPILNETLENSTIKPYFNGSFSYPLLKMENSGLSFGKFITFGNYKIQHLGTDLRAPRGTEILAVNDGKVVLTVSLSNYGKTLIVDHGSNIFSLYLHLDKFKVSEGDMVKKGQSVGLSGDTGYATAPHLHFSMRVGNSRVDPIEFIEMSKKMDENLFFTNLANISTAIYNFFGK